jgi:ABC-2 type transport system ATP-binding protein
VTSNFPPVTTSSTAGPVITVAGLHKSYGRHEAVKGIDFEVAAGEIFGLLGTNGAGKTTTIEILEGYRQRSAGDVQVLGIDPSRPTRAWRERIGLVLQESEVDPVYTAREIVGMFSQYYTKPRDVDDTITLVGLHEQRDTRVGQLSGGQKRRVDVALGIVGDPDLVFLDEPTTGFDPQARRDAWNMIQGLRDLGKTILLTTHYLDEAQELADRVAIVKDGRVLAVGPPQELMTHPPSHPPGTHPPGAAQYHVSYRDGGGRPVELQTEDPTGLLNRLTTEALAKGERLEELSVGRPTLEDVYLELTADA